MLQSQTNSEKTNLNLETKTRRPQLVSEKRSRKTLMTWTNVFLVCFLFCFVFSLFFSLSKSECVLIPVSFSFLFFFFSKNETNESAQIRKRRTNERKILL